MRWVFWLGQFLKRPKQGSIYDGDVHHVDENMLISRRDRRFQTHVDFQEGIVNFWRPETGFKMNKKCDLGGQ